MTYSASRSSCSIDVKSDVCRHRQVQKIGEDLDLDGKLLKLVRCARCGLLMRTYLAYV